MALRVKGGEKNERKHLRLISHKIADKMMIYFIIPAGENIIKPSEWNA